MMLGAEDGCNHPQPTGSNRPLICGREAFWGAFWGVWDACIKRNVKTSLGDPPSAAARRQKASTPAMDLECGKGQNFPVAVDRLTIHFEERFGFAA